MPQTLKEEVRARIVRAAEVVFAASGYRGAKMAAIAKEAGLSTGNLYRYFANKDALFEHMLGADFVREFERLLDRRVQALEGSDLVTLSPEAEAADAQMLRFWLDHRLRVVVLLDRAEGSSHEGFGTRFVERLVALSRRQLAGDRSLPEAGEFMLEQIFDTSRRAVVSILERYADEAEILEALAAFRSYQLAGLAGFRTWMNR